MNPATRRIAAILATFVTGITLAISSPLAASASTPSPRESLQQRIDAIIATYPDGTQIGTNEISWNDGSEILTLETATDGIRPLTVGNCATGDYCVYSGAALSGSKLTFTSCPATQSTAPVGTVRSIANARSTGYVQAKNSSGTVLSTINAGSSLPAAPSGITQVTCVS